MEEKILYNVLRQIGQGSAPSAAPDDDYLKALGTIGFVKFGWDTTLTEFGRKTLNRLQDQQWNR